MKPSEEELNARAHEALFGHTVPCTPEDQARLAWVESNEFDPTQGRVTYGEQAQQEARITFEAALGRETLERALGGRPSLGADHPAGTSRQHQVRFDPELDDQLRSYAAENNLSISDVIRHAVRNYTTRAA